MAGVFWGVFNETGAADLWFYPHFKAILKMNTIFFFFFKFKRLNMNTFEGNPVFVPHE